MFDLECFWKSYSEELGIEIYQRSLNAMNSGNGFLTVWHLTKVEEAVALAEYLRKTYKQVMKKDFPFLIIPKPDANLLLHPLPSAELIDILWVVTMNVDYVQSTRSC